jgi:lysophospholipase L1-like esterase
LIERRSGRKLNPMTNLATRIHREIGVPRRSRFQVWVRRVTTAAMLLLLPVVGTELALRLYGYYRPQIVLPVQWATNTASAATLNQRFETDAFVPDRFLLWKHKPGANVAGLAVDKDGLLVNAGVKKGATSASPKQILCLGDSVSAVTYRTYPHIAERLAEIAMGPARLQFTNAATAGYSTEQGLRWFTRQDKHRADAVVVCFGWNDHFPALNLPDKELGARNAAAAFAHRVFHRSRVYQYLARPRRHNGNNDTDTTQALRVAPGEYKRNLSQFVAQIRRAGAIPILATQPQNLNANNSDYFYRSRFRPGEDLAAYHHAYNMIVREVAAATNAALLDLDEEFDRRNKDWLMEPDGMHLTGPGHNLAARLLVSELQNQKFITPAEFERIVQAARYDTTAPDKPRAAWVVEPQTTIASTTDTLRIGVIAKNTGNSTWLRDHVIPRFGNAGRINYGGVAVTGTWRTVGAPTTATVAHARLSHDLLPGESTSTTLVFASPPAPGIYAMEIGLHADAIGDLKNFGAEVTTVTVATR